MDELTCYPILKPLIKWFGTEIIKWFRTWVKKKVYPRLKPIQLNFFSLNIRQNLNLIVDNHLLNDYFVQPKKKSAKLKKN